MKKLLKALPKKGCWFRKGDERERAVLSPSMGQKGGDQNEDSQDPEGDLGRWGQGRGSWQGRKFEYGKASLLALAEEEKGWMRGSCVLALKVAPPWPLKLHNLP